MISVIFYGRNDGHGYNLHKRAAMSLNCIAELLSEDQDEMLFTDCNTPDTMPTFIEAIQDTLTAKAQSLIRVFRIRPSQYASFRKSSPLEALEPYSRNVAIRRSNPANRWVLSTNTDMIFTPRVEGLSLSQAVADLGDGFYHLPRFELPAALWERMDRKSPKGVIEEVGRLGRSLRLNEVVLGRPEILYDAPGDFQLALRSQLYEIRGFNESMIWGWHADSNLAKRLCLLNGGVGSLLDKFFGYHCMHTRLVGPLHSSSRTSNDLNTFFWNVVSPLANTEDWGLNGQEVEEFRLDGRGRGVSWQVVEETLSGMAEPYTVRSYHTDSLNENYFYDTEHTVPFVFDYLDTLPHGTRIGYFGRNEGMARRLNAIIEGSGLNLQFSAISELLDDWKEGRESATRDFAVVALDRALEHTDVFIFDFWLEGLAGERRRNGLRLPAATSASLDYVRRMSEALERACHTEANAISIRPRRQFLFLGARHTDLESLIAKFFETTATPYCGHVDQGFVRRDSDIGALDWLILSLRLKAQIIAIRDFLAKSKSACSAVAVSDPEAWKTVWDDGPRIVALRDLGVYASATTWAALHQSELTGPPQRAPLWPIYRDMAPVFTTKDYVLFGPSGSRSGAVEALDALLGRFGVEGPPLPIAVPSKLRGVEEATSCIFEYLKKNPGARIGYLGCNGETARRLTTLIADSGVHLRFTACDRMVEAWNKTAEFQGTGVAIDSPDNIFRDANVLLFDFGLDEYCLEELSKGPEMTGAWARAFEWQRIMAETLEQACRSESAGAGSGVRRPYLFLGALGTEWEGMFAWCFEREYGPLGLQTLLGFVRSDLDLGRLDWFVLSRRLRSEAIEVLGYFSDGSHREETLAVSDPAFWKLMPGGDRIVDLGGVPPATASPPCWAALLESDLVDLPSPALIRISQRMKPVFRTGHYVLFSARASAGLASDALPALFRFVGPGTPVGPLFFRSPGRRVLADRLLGTGLSGLLRNSLILVNGMWERGIARLGAIDGNKVVNHPLNSVGSPRPPETTRGGATSAGEN